MSNQKKSDKVADSSHTLVTPSTGRGRAGDDIRHWEGRIIKKQHKKRGGVVTEDKTYSIRLSHGGKQKSIQLDLANKRAAAKKAQEISVYLKASGWEDTLAKYGKLHTANPVVGSSVGDLFKVYNDYSDTSKQTASRYARVFRTMVAEIKGIAGDKTRFDYVNGGAEKWRKKVEAVKLSEITSGKIQKWKKAYMDKHATDPIKEKSAKVTINSHLRYCKSLFGDKVIGHLKRELDLPSPLPFDDVELYSKQSVQYKSKFDIEELILTAKDELPGIDQDQQWLIFILAVSAGLRRNEIDKLTWKQVDLRKMEISMEATKYFKPKSDNSGTEVSIDADLGKLLQGYKAKGTSEFVLVSNTIPNLKTTVAHYRCNRHFKKLNKWLQGNGVEDRKPLHALRKEAGSLVNNIHGLYAASRFLRHADIQVTSAHYIDTKEIITSGLGGLISGKVESIKTAKAGNE